MAAEAKERTVLQLVEDLGPSLTSEEDAIRQEGVDKLSEAAAKLPGSVQHAVERETLLAFFAEKLTDRACISPALRGCISLLESLQQGLPTASATPSSLPLALVRILETKLLREVPIAGLSQENRRNSLRLLLLLVQVCGPQLMETGLSLVDGVGQAVDGERDPRCLMTAFQLIRHTVQLYHASPETTYQLEGKAEDLCDVVACYFPITFRMPPENMHGLTRDDLANSLEDTLSCTPLFAPVILPLLLEKLSSSIWQAKMDSLSGLARCVEAWGAPAAAPHLARIWWALRDELVDPLAPAVPEGGGTNTAVAAAACLRRCIAAEQGDTSIAPPAETSKSNRMLDQVLGDDHVTDLAQWVVESGSAGESETTSKRFATANTMLTAVCAAGSSPCHSVFQKLFGSMFKLSESEDAVPVGLALSSLLAMLRGAVQSRPQQTTALQRGHSCGALITESCSRLLESQLNRRVQDVREAGPKELKVALLRVRLLSQLASIPADGAQILESQHVKAAALSLLAILSNRDCLPELGHEAALGIAQIAGSGRGDLVAECILLGILEATGAAGGMQEGEWVASGPRSPALACLVAISRDTPSLRSHILSGLTQTVQDSLSNTGGGVAPQVCSQLHALAEDILPACERPFTGVQAQSAMALAIGLLESAASGRLVGDLAAAAACATQVATAGCSQSEQGSIACEAARQLHPEEAEVGSAVLAVASAAITALRPGIAFGGSGVTSMEVLRTLLTQSLAVADEPSEVAMAAAASMILKWPAGGDTIPEGVDAAVGVALDDIVLPHIQLQLPQDGGGHRLRSVAALGWLAKATAMRQHPRLSKPLETALAYLEAASLDLATAEEEARAADTGGEGGAQAVNGAHSEVGGTNPGHGERDGDESVEQLEDFFDAEEARAMARVFAVAISPGSGIARLDASLHAVGRILWQQKVFTTALKGLEEKLGEGVGFLGQAPPPLLLGLCHLAGACPPNILAGVRPTLLPWLVAAVAGLAQGPLGDGAGVLSALQVLQSTLADAAGRKLLEGQASELIAALLTAARSQLSPEVRAAALACLASSMALPYNLLYPLKAGVVGALAQAVDDPKRAVRMQAAKTRRLWCPV